MSEQLTLERPTVDPTTDPAATLAYEAIPASPDLAESEVILRDPRQLGESALHSAGVGITETTSQNEIYEEKVKQIVTPIGSYESWDRDHPDTPFEAGSPSVLAEHFKIDEQTAEAALQQAEIMSPHARVAIRLPIENLSSVLKDGRLKSMHETHTSTGQGSGTSNDRHTRRRVEREKFGQQEGDPSIIYGFLADSLTEASDVASLIGYGEVVLILRPEVAERSSFTEGDSLRTGAAGPPLSFEDAVVAQQVNDTLDQQGKAFSRYRNQGIEAQVFGGVGMEDVEAISILIDAASLEQVHQQQMTDLEAFHKAHPDIKISINLDFTRPSHLPRKIITEHPYIEFTPVVTASEVSRDDRIVDNYDGIKDETRAEKKASNRSNYDESTARRDKLQQLFDRWADEHPSDVRPSNLGSVKLLFVRNW